MKRTRKEKMFYYRWCPLDYQRETWMLSLEADALYRRLLDHLYMNGGRIPNDDRTIAAACRVHTKLIVRLKPVLIGFFQVSKTDDGEFLVHDRVLREIQHFNEIKAQTSKAGSASANVRATRVQQPLQQTANESKTESKKELQKRESKASAPTSGASPAGETPIAAALRCLKIVQDEIFPAHPSVQVWSYGEIAGWIATGADVDLDIVPTIRRIAEHRARDGKPVPGGLGYFRNAVSEAVANRSRGLAPVSAGGSRGQPAPAPTPAMPSEESRIRDDVMYDCKLKHGDRWLDHFLKWQLDTNRLSQQDYDAQMGQILAARKSAPKRADDSRHIH